MRIADFDYVLPPEAIAQTPAEPRDSSRMLQLDPNSGEIQHYCFKEICTRLRAGDLLVLNDTKVTALRIFGRKESGGQVEALLLKEVSVGLFEAMMRPGRRLPPGSRVEFEEGLWATVAAATTEGLRQLKFDDEARLSERLSLIGKIPLPPYITGYSGSLDRYQTVYCRNAGSAAAPTAGLHFTTEIFSELASKNVDVQMISLGVSIDTFRPVQSDEIADHKMHGEEYFVSQNVADAVAQCQGRIIAVGTTTVRALESAAIGKRKLKPGGGRTEIFISPGYEFKVIDGMLTNFHMPRTTMMLLISALAGRENVLNSYEVALKHGYRFLSFGDTMLILRRDIDA